MLFISLFNRFINIFRNSSIYKFFVFVGEYLGKLLDDSYLVRKYNEDYTANNTCKGSLTINLLKNLIVILNKPIKRLREDMLDSWGYKLCKGINNALKESIIFNIPSKLFVNRTGLISILMMYPFIDFAIRNVSAGVVASIWDESLFVLALIVFLAASIIDGKLRLRLTKIDLPLLAFISFSVFLVIINSPQIGIAIEGLRVQIEYMFWYFLVINLVKKEEQIKNILRVFVWTNFFVAAYGVFQYIIGVQTPKAWIVASQENISTRVFSIVKSCNLLGSILVLCIPIAIAMIYASKTRIEKILYCICTIVMLACMAFTYSRGAWIALTVGIFIFSLLKDKRILAICAGVLVLLPVIMPSLVTRLLYLFTSDYAQKSAQGGRIERWGKAVEYGMKHPFKGLGIGRFGGATASIHNMPNTFYTDNYYVKTFAENGIIGLVIFIILLVFVVKQGFGIVKLCRGKLYFESISIGIYAGVVGVIVNNAVENVFENAIMTTYFWSILAVLFAIKYLMIYKASNNNVININNKQEGVVLYDES
jgi:O-antigen ligase